MINQHLNYVEFYRLIHLKFFVVDSKCVGIHPRNTSNGALCYIQQKREGNPKGAKTSRKATKPHDNFHG